MTRNHYQGQTPFNRQQLQRFIGGLDPSCRYTQRLASCGTLSAVTHGYVLRCQLAPCPACRSRYAAKQRRAARAMLSGATNADAGMLTIVLGAAADLSEVEAIVAKARWDLRNVVDACRRRDRRWESVAVLAHMEMDAVSAEDVSLLGWERAGLIGELARAVTPVADPIWIPTLHGVLRFDGIDWQEVQMALQRKWPKGRQVHIAQFREKLDLSKNSDNVTNYALKHHCSNTFGHVTEYWPLSWMIEYYGWLAEWTEFLRRTRFRIGRKGSSRFLGGSINRIRTRNCIGNNKTENSIVLPTLYN